MFKPKINYKIVFMRHEFGALVLVNTLTLKAIKDCVKANNKTYLLNVNQPTYFAVPTFYYFVDAESGNQMFFSTKQNPLSADEIDIVMSNKLIRDIMNSALDNPKERIMNMLVGAVFGAMLTAIGFMIYLQQQLDNLHQYYQELMALTGSGGGFV